MIKSLRQARITDGLPEVVAGQDWIIALSEALGLAMVQTLDYADESQIYTRLDTVSEAVLDVLAVNWKIDWYDTSFPVEQKRRIVKSALTVRRLMGTAAAVKLQVDTIYPGATVEEWFQYGGEPGCFRLLAELADRGITEKEYKQLRTGAETTKNVSSHLEEIRINRETAGGVIYGACCEMAGRMDVWPLVIREIETTSQATMASAVTYHGTLEIYPQGGMANG